jgi:hypothetical protein
MEFFGFFLLFGVLGGCGLGLAFLAARFTRDWDSGRGATVLVSLLAPFVLMAYLLFAGYLRNKFHERRGEAYDIDGTYTLPLAHGYYLRFFDEMPWDAYITRAASTGVLNIESIDRVQRLAVSDEHVYGQKGLGDELDGPVDCFFDMDLSSGGVRKFGSEGELRSGAPAFGPLLRPEEVLSKQESRVHSYYFWPLMLSTPFVLLVGWVALSRRAGKGHNLANSTAHVSSMRLR